MKVCSRFQGQNAVITGAAQGIGLAVAQRLADEGATVFLVDRAEIPLQEAIESLRHAGYKVSGFAADLSNLEGAAGAIEAAIKFCGQIDVLVNNVGGTIWKKPFWFYTEEEIIMEVERSFWPTMWMCRATVPHMVLNRQGAIVNVGSNATEGIFRIPYSASKGGVAAITTALAVELADFNIRVNAVSPGATDVPDRKTQRSARPLTEQEQQWNSDFYKYVQQENLFSRNASVNEQAAAIAFLASTDAAYVTGEILDTGKRGASISQGIGREIDLPKFEG